MLRSIYFKLAFNDAADARICMRNVSGKAYYKLFRAFKQASTSQTIVIVRALRTWSFGFDADDIAMLTEACKPNSFTWSFDALTEEEVKSYILLHRK